MVPRTPATLDAERHVREDVPPEVLDAHRRDRGAAASAWQRADADNLDGAGVRAFVATFSQRLSSPGHARELGTQLGAHSRDARRVAPRCGAAHRDLLASGQVIDAERRRPRARLGAPLVEARQPTRTQKAVVPELRMRLSYLGAA